MKVRRIVLCVLVIGAFCTVGWAAGEKKNVVAGLDVEFYATVKADGSYSDSRVTPGNFVRTVGSQGPNGDHGSQDDEFNLTANATRFGFLIQGPQTDDWNFWGQLEFDLYGSQDNSSNNEASSNDNKPHLQTRQAFMVIERPADQWSLLAGQTYDVVGPLNPGTLSYSMLWWAGNYGYWVPQVRLTKDVDVADDTTLQLQFAVARTIGTGMTLPANEPGADDGFPTLQGRAALTFPGIGPDPITVGVSGHYGVEEYDYAEAAPKTGTGNDHMVSWSGGVDATVPVSQKVKLTGEIHTGANLSRYNGGILAGVTGIPGVAAASMNEVRATGGWIAAALGPWNNVCYNIGVGREAASTADVGAGTPDRNSCLFGNAIYNFNEHAAVGLEVAWWETQYTKPGTPTPNHKIGDADALVVMASWIYKTR